MDYDDNDFQSQNPHLAGEGSAKFPPVLRQYALPKFDFDDTLQGHARFDSLVEAEVFLGIERNDDNQWIEDYSRGSSGVGFNSCAAESCSILRRKNVWSEATSSESVEMLLKSVGQEDINLQLAVTGESNACDKLDCLTKQMDHTLNDDGSSFCEMPNLQPTLQSDMSFGKLPGVEEDTRGEQPRMDDDSSFCEMPDIQLTLQSDMSFGELPGVEEDTRREQSRRDDGSSFCEMPDLQPTLQSDMSFGELPGVEEDTRGEQPQRDGDSAFEEVRSVDGILSEADPNVVHEIINMPPSEGNLINDENSKQTSSSTVDISVALSLEEKRTDDFSSSGKHLDDLPTCTQSDSQMLSDHKIQHQMNDLCGKNSAGAQINDIEQVVNADDLGEEDEKPLLSVSTVEEKLVVDPSISDLPSIANMTLKGDSVFHSGNEEVVSEVSAETIKFDDKVLGTSMDGSPSKTTMQGVLPTVLEGDTRIEACASEEKNINAEVCAFQGLKTDSVGQMAYTEKIIVEEQQGLPLDVEIQINNSGSSVSAMEESGPSKAGESFEECVRDIPCKFSGETHELSSLRDVHEACAFRTENLYSEGHMPSSSLAEPTEVWEENTPGRQGDVHTVQVSMSGKEDVTLSSDSASASGKTIQSSSFQESGLESDIIDEKVEHNAIADDESVSVSTVEDPAKATGGPSVSASENASVATYGTVQGDSWRSVENLTKNKDTDHEENQLPPTLVGSTQSDRSGENVETTATDGNSYKKTVTEEPLLDTSQPVTEPHPSQAENSAADVAGQRLCRIVDHSSSKTFHKDDFNTERHDVPQEDVASDMDVDPVFCEPAATACDSATKKSDAKSISVDDTLITQSLPPLLGEKLGTDEEDQDNIEVTPKSVGMNRQQDIAANIECDTGENEGSLSSVAFPQSNAKSSVEKESDNSTDADKAALDSPATVKTVVGSHNVNEKECSKGPVTDNVEVLVGNGRMVGSVWSDSQDPKGNGVSKSDMVTIESSSFVDPPKPFSSSSGQPSPVTQAAYKTSLAVEGSQSSPSLFKTDVKSGLDIALGSPQVSAVNVLPARSRGTSERKPRRASTKGLGKVSSTKGSRMKKSEKVEKSNSLSTSNPGNFHLVQSNEMQHHGHVESGGAKPFVFIGTSTSGIPDLNNSASPSPIFQQPFTDLQQVQLRAQIFVYGALIQGTAPDEAYMLSAFGGPDGGTNLWENSWRICLDRLHGKKSHPINPETPLQLQSGSRSTEQANKQSTLQSKVISSPVSRISSKSNPTALNPMIPLSSPLWSISTPTNALQSSIVPRSPVMDYQQALTPLHPYQTPPVRNFIGHNLSWFSQAPFHSTWVAPQTSAPDSSARFSGFPMTEPVHLTPVKESSVPQSSAIKASGSLVHGGASGNVFTGASPLPDLKKMSVTTGQNPADSKSRRRKKITVSEDPGQMIMQSQPRLKPVSAVVTTAISTLATSPSVHSKAASENLIFSASPLCPTTYLKNSGHEARGAAILSEETLGKVREARQLAEDAAQFASEAVKHSGEVWSQLERQKGSELVSDVEAKVASAAAAIAAAAAVAKAAAAAANVASNAAFQAKLMADEALTSSGNEFSVLNNEFSFHGSAAGVGKATPASILRGDVGGNGSSSIIVVAREAARKRVEAASAASKHAENMDAIVKAAELAAAAVSQAGKIVAMGNPLPLKKLVEAGPEGYWKVPQVSSEDVNAEGANSSIKHPRERPQGKKEIQAGVSLKSTIPGAISMGSVENHPRLLDGFTSSGTLREKDLSGQKEQNVSDLAKTIGVIPESELGARSFQNEHEKATHLNQSSIKEGSHIEVYKDGNGLKAAWFTANVLNLKDGKAYICYTELQPEEGSGQLKEWIALDGQEGMPPRIRISRPINTFRNEGTRKRRRAAAGDHIWSVGDKVDAWMEKSWHEGVVVEKDAKDETTYTVHFPARDETLAVKTWNLRPSLVWTDGEWFESPSSYGNNFSPEIVAQEKRMKLGSVTVEEKGKDKIPTILESVESVKPADSSLLMLSANEKVFNAGRNTQTETKSNTLKTSRTGLQKGASRVIFGVPKPGKKRKFMEVSKHYVADSMQATEANDSVKLVKYLMPQGAASKGLKRTSKFESKEKRANDSKTMGIKSGKPPGVSGRSTSQKESLSASVVSIDDDLSAMDHAVIAKDSESQVGNVSEKHNSMNDDSFRSIGGAVEGSIVFSSTQAPKKASSFNNKPERANKGKLAPAAGKLAKIEEDKVFNGNPTKANYNVLEPRRSNRRIQPTSRLLEGLQSSLTISKIPSVSHDKGHRSQNRHTARGNKI